MYVRWRRRVRPAVTQRWCARPEQVVYTAELVRSIRVEGGKVRQETVCYLGRFIEGQQDDAKVRYRFWRGASDCIAPLQLEESALVAVADKLRERIKPPSGAWV